MRQNVLCSWFLQGLEALDASLVATSMAEYLSSLGAPPGLYGLCITLFWVGRLVALPVFGLWTDNRGFLEPFSVSCMLGFLGGSMYGAADLFGVVWFVPISRLILGCSAGVVSSLMAFTARVAGEEKTKYLGYQLMVFNAVTVMSPLVGSMVALFPQVHVNQRQLLSKFSYCGYVVSLCNVACLAILLRYFKEPERLVRQPESEVASRLSLCCKSVGDVIRQLRKSGAWVCFVVSVQNNFNQTVVIWTLPVLSHRLFQWSQAENGVLLAVMGLIGIGATLLVVRFSESRAWSDRWMVVTFQNLVGLSLFFFVVSFGCRSSTSASLLAFLGVAALWSFGNASQIPGNIGLYTKLVGKKNQGRFQAMLFMVMSVSRALAGGLIGVCGDCEVWVIALILWMIQMIVLVPMYRFLEAPAEEHEGLLGDGREDSDYRSLSRQDEIVFEEESLHY